METKKITPKQRIDLFEKRLAQAVKIFQALNVDIYPNDDQMQRACDNIVNRMLLSDFITDAFLRKLLGFYCYAVYRNKYVSKNVVLTTFYHDISGVINNEICFSPRCEMYGIYYEPKVIELTAREILLQLNQMKVK